MLHCMKSLSALLACLIAVSFPGRLQADDKTHEDAEHAASRSYKVIIHKDGKEQERKFDLNKAEHAKELSELLSQGEVEHLQQDKPVSILALRWDLGLWTLVVFLLLLFILSKLAWKPMLAGLQKREANIRGAVEDAERARDEAKRLRDQLQQEMDHANEKVRDILDEARRDAQHTTDEMIAKARAEIQTERDRLRRELETGRDQALQQISEYAAKLATLVSAKVIRRQLSQEDHRRLVDEAVAELRHAGKERQREMAGVQP